MASFFYGPASATLVVNVRAKMATNSLPILPLVSTVPTFDIHYHATKPAHRCHDICSALPARIVETFQCKFKY
jgi:hypothetical protein